MAVPRIRADYDQLGQVAQRFGAAAEAAGATLQSLQQTVQVLEGGDWVGQGAKAFYQEMSQSVLPSLKRLTSALQAAQAATQAISREMQQAEDAAAAVLRAAGGAGAAAAGNGGLLSSLGDLFGWDALKQPLVQAWQSGQPFTAISRGALFAASLFAGAGQAGAVGQAGQLAHAAQVAGAIRAAKLAASAGLAGRFAGPVDAAQALGQAARGSGEAAGLANAIARGATHLQDPASRVVLGQWQPAGGPIGEAQANGGVWYETADGVYQAAGPAASWDANQAFLQQMMDHGVDKLEFHGLDLDQELLNFDGQPFDAVPARVKEIRYLSDNAGQYGYAQQGNSFVRLPGIH